MPKKPTRGTTAVNIELPTDLMERMRDFARRDMRSLKSEFVRALQLLLDTYDKAVTAGETTLASAASGDTLKESAHEPISILQQMKPVAFAKLLERLAQKKPELYYVALRRRNGATLEEIVAENPTLDLRDTQLLLENIEKAAERESKP